MPKELNANGKIGSRGGGGGAESPDKFQLQELTKLARDMSILERRRIGKSAAAVSNGEGSSPSSSSEEKEINDCPPPRRFEGRKNKGPRGSLSSEADVSSSSLSTSTDGEADMSSSSPGSFNSERFNEEGSKVKTSTPKEKGFRAAGGGDGGLSVAAAAFEPSPRSEREDGGYGGGDGDADGSGGSSSTDWFGLAAPKFGTAIPNRIFVGGISCQTTENDLVRVFSKYGKVRGAKIIYDRGGVSKGYGFVTFETEDEAVALCDSIVNKTFEPVILRDRRLNIAPAIKKQPGICSDSGFSSDGSFHRPMGSYAGQHVSGAGGFYYHNQYAPVQIPPPQMAPIQLQPQPAAYYDYSQQGSPTANAYVEQFFQQQYAIATQQGMLAAASHQQPPPQVSGYPVPQFYAAPAQTHGQAPAQMCYFDGGTPQYSYQVASGSWPEWTSATATGPVVSALPSYFCNGYQVWDPSTSGIPAGVPNNVQYQ